MSEKSAPLMFVWVQLVKFVRPTWVRALGRHGLKRMNVKRDKRDSTFVVTSHQTIPVRRVPMSSLSSRRLANQSRDLLQAISARGDHGTAERSQNIG